MSAFSAGNHWRLALLAPTVAAAYVLLAYTITRVGCMPPFSDARFFGVPVTFFLILALTATALVFIVIAAAGAWRSLRVLRRRRRAFNGAVAGALLAVAAFAATATAAAWFLITHCR